MFGIINPEFFVCCDGKYAKGRPTGVGTFLTNKFVKPVTILPPGTNFPFLILKK